MLGHPSRDRLTAWYDQELDDAGITAHLANCRRCAGRLAAMARVDAALRGERIAVPARWRPQPARSAAPLAVAGVLAAFLVLAAALQVPVRDAYRSITSEDRGDVAADGTGSAGGAGPVDGEPGVPDRPQAHPAGGPPVPAAGVVADGRLPALVLATVVPRRGPSAATGEQVVRAARAAADLANVGGGVRGRPVEMAVVAAEDLAAGTADLSGVTALVGGFGAGAPAGVPWVMPADPAVVGDDVVAAEVEPFAAGARLGRSVASRSGRHLVGVVRAPGSDEEPFAEGLSSTVATREVVAPGTSCSGQVRELVYAGSTALAVAGPAELASRCLLAAAGRGWVPRDGFLVAPSAAYAGPASLTSLAGAETVLGAPWPSTPHAAAGRFRASVPDAPAYQALVTFAAVELAVDVARTTGTVSREAMAGRAWRSDLYTYEGPVNAGAVAVRASFGAWRPRREN